MTKRVLLLAATTGYQTRAFGDAAERIGVTLVFATDRCDRIDDPWRDGAIAIRFHEEHQSVQAIVEVARGLPIDGILALGDRPTVIAARVAQALGLPGHPPDAAAAARDKLRTRERLRDAGLPVPWFFSLPVDVEPSAIAHPASHHRAVSDPQSYPCIVKPLALSGSRGVMRADDPASFDAASRRLRALLSSPDVRAERNAGVDAMLVEGFIPGREYAVEGLMDRGELRVLAIFDKPDPLDGPFFEETIYVTPSSASPGEQRAIVLAIANASSALGLTHGPVHAECRLSPGAWQNPVTGQREPQVHVLEVAARPIGGLCARALRFVRVDDPRIPHPDSRIPLEELLLRHALGEPADEWRREDDASGVMMIPIPRRGTFRGADGVEAARAVADVTDVAITAKQDQLLVPVPEGASYLGFIFARARTAADAERALRTAHARLRFQIDVEFPMYYNPVHG